MSSRRSFVLPTLALLLCAVAWGSTVVVVKSAFEDYTPENVLITRLLLTALSVTPLAFSLRRASRRTILRGTVLGLIFNGSMALQNFGLDYTPPSLSGFITASYVIFTALISAVALGTRQTWATWTSIALTVAGITILAMGHEGGAGFGFGAGITLVGAVGFAVHIVLLGKWVRRDTLFALTFTQAAAGAVAALLFAPFVEYSVPPNPTVWLQLLYLGIFCGGVTLFLQSWAQNYVPPTPASVIMCTEPVWGAILSISLGFEPLTVFAVAGGSMVVIALLLTVKPRRRSRMLDRLVEDLRRRVRLP